MSLLAEPLVHLLNVRDVCLQVLVPLELSLNLDDVFGVPDLAVVGRLELSLERVELPAQVFALALDLLELFLSVLQV